ncbi:MAG: YbaB/EbfC family nucleoid-associated protein [Bdellovibrionales bacterium]|nr:YbaB/EbfC family nucleoid-associated protein [Bdellovibrionales bacterium]
MKGMGGMQQMLKQANQLQRKMEKLQAELAERTYTATAGGNGVTITVKGESTIQNIEVNEDLIKEGDLEMIVDLIKLASNEALKNAKEENSKEMSKLTGGLGGMLGGLV